MRYEHTPRPEVEYHPHIRELIEIQDKRAHDRNYHREKEKNKQEREGLIKEARHIAIIDFYCDRCKEDFKAQSLKDTEQDWTHPSQRFAFYRTKCFKNHWCIRFITDKDKDAYWTKSKAVSRDRANHYADTLQPFETGFNMLYKKI